MNSQKNGMHVAFHARYIMKLTVKVHSSVITEQIISFTGETMTGTAIVKAGAVGFRPVSLELGGNNAAVVFGGGVPDVLKDGCWVAPTSWAGLPETATVVRKEIFGPCCHITPFDTEEEAVRTAYGAKYGLATSIYTQDFSCASRLATQIEVGLSWKIAAFCATCAHRLAAPRSPASGAKAVCTG
jgi:acyl-CoA reductase-like NAD-dependent aldehyde dehydrogenase